MDDGWGSLDELADDPAPATEVFPDRSRTIIAHNDSPRHPLRPVDQPLSRLRAWLHLLLCPAQPRLSGPVGRARFRDQDLRQARRGGTAAAGAGAARLRAARSISLGANTDPYQPLERRLRITRQVLEVLAESRHPVGIVTKSALVTARHRPAGADWPGTGLARVYVSVTTLDPEHRPHPWSRGPQHPHRRLKAIRALAEAGVAGRRHGGADHPGADRPRDRARSWRRGRRRARSAPVSCWSGCPTR